MKLKDLALLTGLVVGSQEGCLVLGPKQPCGEFVTSVMVDGEVVAASGYVEQEGEQFMWRDEDDNKCIDFDDTCTVVFEDIRGMVEAATRQGFVDAQEGNCSEDPAA